MPQLNEDGSPQNTESQDAVLRLFRRQDLLYGRHPQLQPQEQHDKRDNDPAEVFNPGVAEGMLFIRRLSGQLEAYQHDNGGAGIRQVVHGVRHNGQGVRKESGQKFDEEQQQVGGDPHSTRRTAAFLPDFRICRRAVALDQKLHD